LWRLHDEAQRWPPALDPESEQQLFERYAGAAARHSAVAGGGITLLVSHRFSTDAQLFNLQARAYAPVRHWNNASRLTFSCDQNTRSACSSTLMATGTTNQTRRGRSDARNVAGLPA
jgi:broad specificity phosphatase PhoE